MPRSSSYRPRSERFPMVHPPMILPPSPPPTGEADKDIFLLSPSPSASIDKWSNLDNSDGSELGSDSSDSATKDAHTVNLYQSSIATGADVASFHVVAEADKDPFCHEEKAVGVGLDAERDNGDEGDAQLPGLPTSDAVSPTVTQWRNLQSARAFLSSRQVLHAPVIADASEPTLMADLTSRYATNPEMAFESVYSGANWREVLDTHGVLLDSPEALQLFLKLTCLNEMGRVRQRELLDLHRGIALKEDQLLANPEFTFGFEISDTVKPKPDRLELLGQLAELIDDDPDGEFVKTGLMKLGSFGISELQNFLNLAQIEDKAARSATEFYQVHPEYLALYSNGPLPDERDQVMGGTPLTGIAAIFAENLARSCAITGEVSSLLEAANHQQDWRDRRPQTKNQTRLQDRMIPDHTENFLGRHFFVVDPGFKLPPSFFQSRSKPDPETLFTILCPMINDGMSSVMLETAFFEPPALKALLLNLTEFFQRGGLFWLVVGIKDGWGGNFEWLMALRERIGTLGGKFEVSFYANPEESDSTKHGTTIVMQYRKTGSIIAVGMSTNLTQSGIGSHPRASVFPRDLNVDLSDEDAVFTWGNLAVIDGYEFGEGWNILDEFSDRLTGMWRDGRMFPPVRELFEDQYRDEDEDVYDDDEE
ncbi:hypothetical protein P7C73_g4785, partial [Tremellales sp. Uapishka_1]